MSASVHVDAGRQPQGEADLTDDQIQQLLQEAEGRLRGDDAHLIKSTNADTLRYVFEHSNFSALFWRSIRG